MTSGSIERVLVIFPGALGDLMCLLPALEAIARRHPGASVELMARGELARLVAGRSVIARAHSIDAREVGGLFSESGAESGPGFFADFDRIYSFFASDDERFRARLAAATDGVVSFHPFRPGGDGHVSEAYLRAIDADAALVDARLEPTAEDLAAAERVLVESKCDVSRFILILPGSGSPSKNWPADKFAALASLLARRFGILRSADFALNDTTDSGLNDTSDSAVNDTGDGRDDNGHIYVVVLGPAEESIEPIFCESGVMILKELELPTVAAIARLAAAFVGNDSGVSHLAAAVGASGVAIFGATDPARWRPIGAGRVDVLWREPIDSIEVAEVAGALAKFVDGGQK